jgi:hypothetical protein
MRALGGVLLALAVVITGCGDDDSAASNPSPAWAASWQQTVFALRDLQPDEVPDHLLEPGAARDGSEFDVEEYFAVLDRIGAEPGFTLDYVYRVTADRGFPILYVHREDETGYAGFDEFAAATGASPAQGDAAYFDQIYVIDGTPEGFFQYVVLHVMGGQFYLHWHAQDDDAGVVVTREALDAALDGVESDMPDAEMEKAREIDPTPRIVYDGDVARVEVHVFTRWGGLLRYSYVIERIFPQRILEFEIETVAACDCSIPY